LELLCFLLLRLMARSRLHSPEEVPRHTTAE